MEAIWPFEYDDHEYEAKFFNRPVFIAINILCKFGEDIIMNECDIKVYVKT